MNIKKIGSGLVVAISMLAFNAAAQADHNCGSQIDGIKTIELWLNCDKTWTDDPIWQFQGGKGKNKDVTTDGCEVHKKLSKLLYELRTDEPPIQGGKNGKGNGNNQARGAANDLDDHKYQSAVDQLQLFQDTIENDAKLNPDFEPTDLPYYRDAQMWADFFKDQARIIQDQIDPETGTCSP